MTAPQLPRAEMDVLICLVTNGPLRAVEIRELLESSRPMSHSSVCTLLDRLLAKSLVRREKGTQGKAYVYSSTNAAARAQRNLIGDFLDRLFGGSGVDLVATLLESRPPSPEELDQMQALLDGQRTARRPRRARVQRGDS